MRRLVWLNGVLLILVTLSAVGVIYSHHRSRELFTELDQLVRERDHLDIDWGRLQLEQSAWSTQARVEKVAREKLSMQVPESERLVFMHSVSTPLAIEGDAVSSASDSRPAGSRSR